ncbi:hypothetical protein PSHI_48520 [Pseudomonas sp. URMO17WK12:I11]|nr:hypothetical protein PSHI_48520 [Pseudomonas sp. URMO17WK12:I11]
MADPGCGIYATGIFYVCTILACTYLAAIMG